MTRFEQMLIDKGYIKHIFNVKRMRFELTTNHVISTMINLDHRYFHNTNLSVLDKIKEGKSVMDEDFPDRSGEIIFGLHEANKPPTLISPRPTVQTKKIINGEIVYLSGQYDDNTMNRVLSVFDHEEILKAMFDYSIVLKIDETV